MKAAVVLLLSVAGLAQAEEEEKQSPLPPQQMEEVVVTGYYNSWDQDYVKHALMVGISGAYLIHEYDKGRDEWRFVRASNEPKKDNE